MGPKRTRQTDPDAAFPPGDTQALLQLLAQQQSVLTTIATSLAHQTIGSPPKPAAVKSLPIPKLPSSDNLSIIQFRDWKLRWADYYEAQQLSLQTSAIQHGILRSALDTEWTCLWTSGRLSITPATATGDILSILENYLRSRRNPLLDRQEFHRREQMSGESVDRYYATLKALDDACDHDVDLSCPICQSTCTTECSDQTCQATYPLQQYLQDVRIRDRLICGLRDKEMQRRILAEQYDSVLTVNRVLAICSAFEQSCAAGASLDGTSASCSIEANATKSTYKKQQLQPNNHRKTEAPSSEVCWGCGKGRHDRSQCKAYGQQCDYCGKLNHFKSVCRQLKKDASNPKPSIQSSNPSATGMSASTSGPTNINNTVLVASNRQLLAIQTIIGTTSHILKWLPDTGADMNTISLKTLQDLGTSAVDAMTSDKLQVIAANGEHLDPIGSIRATFTLNGRSYTATVGVFKHVITPLLCKEGCIALGLIDPNWPLSKIFPLTNNAISTGKPFVSPFSKPQELGYIKDNILREYAPAFNDVTLRPMTGPPMIIQLIQGAIPCKRYKAHTIPFHWRDAVKEQLDAMVTKGIIEPVPVGEAIDWCHPMVVVPKKGTSEPRITVDLTGLNRFVRRPAYPVKVPKEVISRIPPGNCYFTTLDARHGYWQVPLDEDSKKLTNFITPWGSYRYLRNVMGLISAGDEHNRRGDDALQGISQTEKIVEDILIYDTDLDSHIRRVKQVIERCQAHGITLNAKKFVFAQPEVDWCGFRISSEGYTNAPHLVSALLNFPVPTSKTDVRSFCGLVQQFEAFSHEITALAAPLRSLLSASSSFLWEEVHQQAFESLIQELSSTRVLTQFYPGRPLRLETDAAQSRGLEYALWQQQPDTSWKLLQVGSRFVTPTEARYSATEVELLAVVWATRKCRLFLLGQRFDLIVDHRPLIPIINSKTLDEIENPRLQRLKEKLACFTPQAIWRAGSKHTVVDVFSGFPTTDPDDSDLLEELDSDPTPVIASALIDSDTGSPILSDSILQGLSEAAHDCSTYQRLLLCIRNGFPRKEQLDEDLTPFWKLRDALMIHDELIFLGSRLLIPISLRGSILKTLHMSHQGQDRTLRRARQCVFWPNITNDIRNVVKDCKECARYLPSHSKEPLQPEPPSDYPYQSVGVDIFSHAGYEYLIMVDRFSGWIHVAKCGSSANTSKVIYYLKQWMTDVGIPTKLVSDNGPQFSSSEFANWTRKWGIKHSTSSPHYPQSNGLAESAVKAVKHLLAKTSPNGDLHCESFQLGLLELRNTPRQDGRSPAQLLYGTPTRTTLPLHHRQFAAIWKDQQAKCDARGEKLRQKAQERYDSTAHPLLRLKVGDIVLVQDHRTQQWTTIAEIIDILPRGRSYTLRTESGRLFRRNRRFLRPFRHSSPTPPLTPATAVLPRRSTRQRSAPVRFGFSNQCASSHISREGMRHHASLCPDKAGLLKQEQACKEASKNP